MAETSYIFDSWIRQQNLQQTLQVIQVIQVIQLLQRAGIGIKSGGLFDSPELAPEISEKGL